MPKKKYVKRPFPRKGVDWDKIKKESTPCKNQATNLAPCAANQTKKN